MFRVIRGTAPDGKQVALKLFPLGSDTRDKATARFMREAERLCRRWSTTLYTFETPSSTSRGRVVLVSLSCRTMGEAIQWLEGGEPRASSAQVRSVLRDALLGLSFCHLTSSLPTSSLGTMGQQCWATLTCRTMTGFG
jgi:hypothetical protein